MIRIAPEQAVRITPVNIRTTSPIRVATRCPLSMLPDGTARGRTPMLSVGSSDGTSASSFVASDDPLRSRREVIRLSGLSKTYEPTPKWMRAFARTHIRQHVKAFDRMGRASRGRDRAIPVARRRTVLVQLNSLAIGGTQINAVDFAVAVRPHGYDSILVGPRDTRPEGPSLMELAAERGVIVEPFDRASGGVIGRANALTERVRSLGADLVHVYASGGDARSAFWGPCLAARRPLVQTVYEMDVGPEVYRHTPLVIGTGYLRDDLRDRPGRTVLISPPVDLVRDAPNALCTKKFVETLGIPAGQRRVVLVSRLDEDMKALSIETAIKAIARLSNADVALVVVGTGDAERRLRALGADVDRESGKPMVVFTGPLTDPRPAYACADIALGMGGSAARALAFGRPLVVQGQFGRSEVFTPIAADDLFRRSFWSDTAPSDPVGELVIHLQRLLADPAERHMLGSYGREFATSRFGLEEMATRLADLYSYAIKDYGVTSWLGDVDQEALAAWRKWGPFSSTHPRAWLGRRIRRQPAQ